MSAAKAAPSNSRLVDRSALQARPQARRGGPGRRPGRRPSRDRRRRRRTPARGGPRCAAGWRRRAGRRSVPRSSPPARRPRALRRQWCGRCRATRRGRCRHERAGRGDPRAAAAARTTRRSTPMPRSPAAFVSAAWTLVFHCSSQSTEPGSSCSSAHHWSNTAAEILYDWWKAQRSSAPSGTPQSARVEGRGRARRASFGW